MAETPRRRRAAPATRPSTTWPGLLLAATLLAACQGGGAAPDATRPGSLTIGVGGSVGMSGAAVSQPRTDAAGPRTRY